MLDIAGLRVAYDDGPAIVRGVDLRLRAGETYGLVGESGCGKSTIAYAVERHLEGGGRITGGTIKVDGIDVETLSPGDLRRWRGSVVSLVQQNPTTALNPSMRIGSQLLEVFAGRPGRSADDRDAQIDTVLRRVRFQDPRRIRASWPHQLSGGQVQRVTIAMALLTRPKLLLLDEPTTGLDATIEAEVATLVKEIARDAGDMALLYISHNLGLIARVADRIGVMYAGQIVEEGTARAVLKTPAHPYTRSLLASLPGNPALRPGDRLHTIPGQVPRPEDLGGGCAFLPRCPSAKPGLCDTGVALTLCEAGGEGHVARCLRLGDLADQAFAPQAHSTPARDGSPAIVEIADLDRTFRSRSRFGGASETVVAANGVSFTIGQGEIVSLVGESGSGKSTIARILTGLDTADSGRALGFGVNLAQLPAEERAAALVSAIRIIFQNPDNTLNPAHRIGRILRRALKRGGRPSGADAVADLVRAVRLPSDAASRFPSDLSGGQRQRVAIARALAGRADLIIADEPVAALDVSVQAAIIELLRDVHAGQGSAILFISHDLDLVRHISDRVVVLYRGTVVEQGPAAAVFAAPHHPYTEVLLAAVHPPDPDHDAPEMPFADDSGAGPEPGLCPFVGRCHRSLPVCRHRPAPEQRLAGQHMIRCHIDFDHSPQNTPPQPRG